MPWKSGTTMSLRLEFVQLACQEGSNISQLCRGFGISRETGYKWLRRFRQSGGDPRSLVDRSRRPHTSPNPSPPCVQQAVLRARAQHPAWGGRKIRALLLKAEHTGVPPASTITAILHRHQQIDPAESRKHRPFQRFEMEAPNQLWQMDFKGYFPLTEGQYCHSLTVLDDHSRFLVGLRACADQTCGTVQAELTAIFRCYGLPQRMLMDNGSPWGDDAETRHTKLTAWLIRLGIAISHGRPYHPQTQGKDERLHRTLNDELLSRHAFARLDDCQEAFDQWRQLYNCQRPHEALDMGCPDQRYRPSSSLFPDPLPPVLYNGHDMVRKTDAGGRIHFTNRALRIGKAFRHQPVAIRPTDTDQVFDVFFSKQKIAVISLAHDPPHLQKV